jgi:SAM-dependent methyltransferase
MNRFSRPRLNVKSDRLWNSALGQKSHSLQITELSPLLRRLHGDVVLWVGECQEIATALEGCMIRHTVFGHQSLVRAKTRQSTLLRLNLEKLPFATGSLHGVVLHHSLELVRDPRAAIKEVERVLVPGGKLIICGFNPFSLYGLRRLCASVIVDPMSERKLINPIRLFDWLELLDLKLDGRPKYFAYGLPISHSPLNALLRRFPSFSRLQSASGPWFISVLKKLTTFLKNTDLPFGGLLVISATKQSTLLNMRMIDARAGGRTGRSFRPAALHSISETKKHLVDK